MNYIDRIAKEIRSAVPDGSDLPAGDLDALFRLYALLLLVKRSDVSAEDVHNAWAVWMSSNDPSHESIKPFYELDHGTRHEDDLYVSAIKKVASQQGR
jgi:hypothetical protein